jgi:F0F1-type ATP synthase delta subunit
LSFKNTLYAFLYTQGAPIQLHGLEGRYAHAIYAAASKKNQLEAVDKDFQNILVNARLPKP